jgi:hypothetical protein
MGVLIAKQCWHPIAALTTSILWFGLWTVGTSFNVLVVTSNEISFESVDTWYKICYVESAIQAVFAAMYFVMMGFAALAVHEWRKERKCRSVRVTDTQADVDSDSDVELKQRRASMKSDMV